MSDQEKGLFSHSNKFIYSEKRWYEFLRDYGKFLYKEIGTFFATTISLWAVAQILAIAGNDQIGLGDLAVPVLILASITSMYKAYIHQKRYVPESLKSESSITQKMFRKQNFGWNIAIARQMLMERIKAEEASLDRIRRGAEFVEPQIIDNENYIKWLNTRLELLRRLVNSVARICTHDLPEIIGNIDSEENLDTLKIEIDALAKNYMYAKKCEIECYKYIPPNGFERIHEMSYGWSKPIRKGVHDFVEILDKLANMDRKQLKSGLVETPSFNIEFEVPENLDEFTRRLGELQID